MKTKTKQQTKTERPAPAAPTMTRAELVAQLRQTGIRQQDVAREVSDRTGVPVSAPRLSRWLTGVVAEMRGVALADVERAVKVLLAQREAKRVRVPEEPVALPTLASVPAGGGREEGEALERALAMRRGRLPVEQLSDMELLERIEFKERCVSISLREIAENDHAESPEQTAEWLAEDRAELAEALAEYRRRAGDDAFDEKCSCGRLKGRETFCPRCGARLPQ